MTTSQASATGGHLAGGKPGPRARSERRRAQELLLVLGRVGRAVHDALAAHAGGEFAGNAEVLVITSLDTQGPLRPSDIAQLTGMTSGGVTKLLDRLEKHGLIVREFGVIPDDRRGTRLVLTDEGEAMADAFARALLSELETLRQAMEELQAAITD